MSPHNGPLSPILLMISRLARKGRVARWGMEENSSPEAFSALEKLVQLSFKRQYVLWTFLPKQGCVLRVSDQLPQKGLLGEKTVLSLWSFSAWTPRPAPPAEGARGPVRSSSRCCWWRSVWNQNSQVWPWGTWLAPSSRWLTLAGVFVYSVACAFLRVLA